MDEAAQESAPPLEVELISWKNEFQTQQLELTVS
jgi:hypothetical protein